MEARRGRGDTAEEGEKWRGKKGMGGEWCGKQQIEVSHSDFIQIHQTGQAH